MTRLSVLFSLLVACACSRSGIEPAWLDESGGLGANTANVGGTSHGSRVGEGGAQAGSTPARSAAGTADQAPEGETTPQATLLFIEAKAVDVAHDAKRQRLYVSTPDGQVLRYHLGRRAFDAPIEIGGSLKGLALSPDQDTLVVADEGFMAADPTTLSRNWVYVIDLNTGSGRKVEFSDEFYEGGTFIPVFIDDTTVLISSMYPGSGDAPARRLHLEDDSYDVLDTLQQDAALVASADGSLIAYAAPNSSAGPFGYYDVASGKFTHSSAEVDCRTIGVARDASQFSVPTYQGMYVFDRKLARIKTLGSYGKAHPVGVVYSPVSDLMYLSWEDDERLQPSLAAYDTHTFERVAVLDREGGFPSSRFAPGQLRISRDGLLLFVLDYDGIRVFAVR